MHKETRPMLCEDGYSDEEIRITQRSKKYQYLHSGRHNSSREKLIGATRIISAWPDHLPSTFSLWTLAMASLFILAFVIYSNVAAFSMLPSQLKPRQFLMNKENLKESQIPVFMHIIINNNKDADLRKHVLNIHSFIDDFPELQYNLIVLYNDTIDPNFTIKPTEDIYNNDLNLLKNDENNISYNMKSDDVLNIQYNTLSKYLDVSPISKYWRLLPDYFISFIVRAISIWDKGGIAFDPNILLSDFQTIKYINKLAEIMERYGKFKEQISVKGIKRKQNIPSNRRLDNIRAIIDQMENNTMNNLDIIQENLSGQENNVFNTYVKTGVTGKRYLNKKYVLMDKINKKTVNFGYKFPVIINPNITKSVATTEIKTDTIENTNILNTGKDEKTKTFDNIIEKPNLSLDLNGLIIATDTPCHAFLGTLFSNSYHYFEEQSVTDFIIRELTIFCNGLLSSCKGIDLIFV